MKNRIMTLAGTTTLAAALTFSTAFAAGAQQSDARWQAWVGCWQPSSNGSAIAGAATLCVSPVRSGAAIEIATIDSGVVKARDTVDASGALRTIDKDGCKGTERGEWSQDARRVFRHVELTCTGGLKRVANTITSITPNGEWLDVQSVDVNGASAVRATHYFSIAASNTAGLPTEFKNVGADMGLAVASARTSAAAALNIASLVEAVHSTDTLAVQAWIIERGAAFTNLDGKMLVRLADAGVPSAVTDVMIGASYPDHFALKAAAPTSMGYNAYSDVDSARIANRMQCRYGISAMWSALYDQPCGNSFYSSRYASRYGYYDYLYGSSYGMLGYNPYYNSLFYGGVYGGYYGAPVVIVKGSDAEPPHGRVVNGRGYSCGSCSTTRSGGSTTSSGSSSSSGGVDRSGGYSGGGSSASTAPSSGSTSSSSGSSSGDGGRTAHPRPPQQ